MGFGLAAYQEGSDTRNPSSTAGHRPPVITDHVLVPIMLAFRELRGGKPGYYPTELEMAGLIWAVKKLRLYVESTTVEFITDYQANEAIAKMKNLDIISPHKGNLKLQS